MADGRRFEDNISIDDLMKKPTKELLVMNYVQAVRTNGTVQKHEKDIECLKEDMKDKIGMRLFAWLSGAIAFVIILFNVIDRVMA